MHLFVNRLTALRALRLVRASGRAIPAERLDLARSDPSPHRHWSARLVPRERLALDELQGSDGAVSIAVPSKGARVRAAFACCTVYAKSLPAGSFVNLGDGLAASCPELLFVECAPLMPVAVHVLLGYELCGTFARDPRRPRSGPVAFDVPSATSTDRIARFIGDCHNVRGCDVARRNLAYVRDNAWSPAEAVLATMAALPINELGYGAGDLVLNRRHELPAELVRLGRAASRVPDIEVADSRVGFNYDGRNHFDLDGLVRAARAESGGDEKNRGADARRATERLAAALRERYVDDLRRNRELAAVGRIVLPVASEDLFRQGGLDAVMLEADLVSREFDGKGLGDVRAAVKASALSRRRQQLIWSLLPWRPGVEYSLQLRDDELAALRQMTVREEEIAF